MTSKGAAADVPELMARAARLEAEGRMPEVLATQAQIQLKAGEAAAALALAELAVALQPGLATTWRMVASLRYRRGDLAGAVTAFEAAAEAAPDEATYRINLADLHRERGDPEAALAWLGRAAEILARRPDARGLCLLASAYLDLGRREAGLRIAMAALGLTDEPAARQLFVRAIRGVRITAADGRMRRLLARAIAEPWGRPGSLARVAVEALRAGGGFGAVADGAADLWVALLTSVRVADAEVEVFLTGARRALLEAAVAGEAADDPERLRFRIALAHQAFINEYAYALADDEAETSAGLADRIADDLAAGRAPEVLPLIAVAAYRPLAALPAAEQLLAYAWPEPVAALLAEQIQEPLREAALRTALPRLTPVSDAISQQVQDQYEANPYPRWMKLPPPGEALPVARVMRAMFPRAALDPIPGGDAAEVLIAGCGTGQQLAGAATRFAGATTLAVDLSLASLAYAQRKAQALGLPRVSFGQADILELGRLGRSFDVIECTGVLHHLADPAAGLAVLAGLLRPGGVMLLAFYSELGRRDLEPARRLAQAYDSSETGLRRFRAAVIASPPDAPERAAMQFGDFFTLSSCRDLLFHVQEHRFALPELAAMLARNGLVMLGMQVEPEVMAAYRRAFPQDPAATDLGRWAAFEADHPDTFRGMYQFWVQKPAT